MFQFLQNLIPQLRYAPRPKRQNHVTRLHALHDRFDAAFARTRVFRAAVPELPQLVASGFCVYCPLYENDPRAPALPG